MVASDDKALLEEHLALKAIKAVGPGGEEPETPVETFWRSCRNFLRGWQLKHKESVRHSQTPVLFVFSPVALPGALRPTAIKAPAFKTIFPQRLGGNCYICNENLREVRQETVGFKDELEPLRFLEEQKLLGCAAVVFLPQQDALVLHECDADLEDVIRLELGLVSSTPFQFTDLDSYLSRFYRQFVERHDGACDIWANATTRELKPKAERQIQRVLKAFLDLTIANYGAKIDQEIMTWGGRSDVRVLAYKDSMNWEQAIMELKILQSSPNPRDWALQGVQQLIDYRQEYEKQTVACYLCCYDARRIDADIPEVVAATAANSFHHRRYFMKTPGVGLRS